MSLDRGSMSLLVTLFVVALLPALSDLIAGDRLGAASNVGLIVAALSAHTAWRELLRRARGSNEERERD